MFAKFYNKELTEINVLQKKLIVVYDLYINKNYNIDQVLIALLNETIEYYKSKFDDQQTAWAQSLLSELKTAKRGIHPFTLERITVRKNELCLTTCYKIIQNMNDKLSSEISKLNATLEEGATLLKQIILAGIQLNVLTPAEIKNAETQKSKKELWDKLLGLNNGMQQLTRSLVLLISVYDIYILLDELRKSF